MEYTNLIKILNTIGTEIRDKYKEKIKTGAYATGKLYNSVQYKVNVTDNSVKLSLNLEDYWINVENGRVAGKKMPPISVIRKWMLSKSIPDKNGLAYLISRKISKKGIKAKPYLRQTKNEVIPNYMDDITKAINKDLKESIKIIKNDNKK